MILRWLSPLCDDGYNPRSHKFSRHIKRKEKSIHKGCFSLFWLRGWDLLALPEIWSKCAQSIALLHFSCTEVRFIATKNEFLVAGWDLFARPSRIVVARRNHRLLLRLLALWGIASQKQSFRLFLLAHPRPLRPERNALPAALRLVSSRFALSLLPTKRKCYSKSIRDCQTFFLLIIKIFTTIISRPLTKGKVAYSTRTCPFHLLLKHLII